MDRESARCSCWVAPRSSGRALRGCAISAYDSVLVRCTDGSIYEGWSLGPTRPNNGPLALHLETLGAPAEVLLIPLASVASVDTQSERPTIRSLLRELAEALAAPRALDERGLSLRALVSDHEVLEVDVRLTRSECLPH